MDSCIECASEDNLHDHHVVPESRGGTVTVPLCGECHAKAHGYPERTDYDISSLTEQALASKRKKGEKTGGAVPYGYRLDDDGKTLVEHPEEQRILDIIQHSRQEGLSYRKIAKRLEDHGFEPKGKRFYANTVRRIWKGVTNG